RYPVGKDAGDRLAETATTDVQALARLRLHLVEVHPLLPASLQVEQVSLPVGRRTDGAPLPGQAPADPAEPRVKRADMGMILVAALEQDGPVPVVEDHQRRADGGRVKRAVDPGAAE